MTTTNKITSLPRGTRVTLSYRPADEVYVVASEVLYDVTAKKSFVQLVVEGNEKLSRAAYVAAITVL